MMLAGTLCGCHASSTGHNIDGVRLYQQGQPQSALPKFQQAIAANPQDADAYYNLAATYHELGKRQGERATLEQAEGIYHQCLDLDPNHVECHRALAVLLVETGRPDSAFTFLERWIQASPQLAEARIELARLYEEFGDRTLAERYLTEALNLDANNPRAWTALARLREQRGDLDQALANYQQAYAINRFQPGIALRIAQLQQQLGGGPAGGSGGTLATQPRTIAR
jgi:tetratricopeptide (TPR) repeat protein